VFSLWNDDDPGSFEGGWMISCEEALVKKHCNTTAEKRPGFPKSPGSNLVLARGGRGYKIGN
jgi:hypothetical protein